MKSEVILVDINDKEIGIGEKLAVHQAGKLHRAFSIYIFNLKGELLIQKRAAGKYHSGGLWSNTCCSHPRPEEQLDDAVHRRLKEEMNLDCDLKEVNKFIYRIEFDNGLTEHEYLHVFVGKSDDTPVVDSSEAEAWKWIDPKVLQEDMKNNPNTYTYWFRISLEDVLARTRVL